MRLFLFAQIEREIGDLFSEHSKSEAEDIINNTARRENAAVFYLMRF